MECAKFATALGKMSTASFCIGRVVVFLFVAYFAYSAVPLRYRLASNLLVVAAAAMHPPLSIIGRPLEPVISTGALIKI